MSDLSTILIEVILASIICLCPNNLSFFLCSITLLKREGLATEERVWPSEPFKISALPANHDSIRNWICWVEGVTEVRGIDLFKPNILLLFTISLDKLSLILISSGLTISDVEISLGSLFSDGKLIYEAENLKVGLFK